MKNFNFVVAATLQAGGQPLRTTSFRVHVHNSITSAWMTPVSMDAVQEEPDHMFSIYAEFSDGTVGDITYHHGITWSTNQLSKITMTNVGKFTPVLDQSSIGPASALVLAALPATLNSIFVTDGIVNIVDSWQNPFASPTNRPRIDFIRGPNKMNYNDPDMSNILFVSEGFNSLEEDYFNTLTSILAGQMEEPSQFPWSTLVNKINFWSLFLPSADQECTVLSEQIPYNQLNFEVLGGEHYEPKMTGIKQWISNADAYLKGYSFISTIGEIAIKVPGFPDTDSRRYQPLNRATKIASPELSLSALIEIVGYPTPCDTNQLTTSEADLLNYKWKILYDPGISLEGVNAAGSKHVPKDTFIFWAAMANRRLTNHRNTAFKIAIGGTPRTDRFSTPDRNSSFHLNNLRRANVDQLLYRIREGATVTDPIIGYVWGRSAYTD